MYSSDKPNLMGVIFPDNDRVIDMLFQSLSIYMNEHGSVSFETMAREILTFSTDNLGNVFYNPPTDKYPYVDWTFFAAKINHWAALLRQSIPGMQFIEVGYHQNLVNGLEFLVFDYTPNNQQVSQWS